MRKNLISSILLIILTTIFAIQNANNVAFKFLFFKIDIPFALVIIICLITGIIIGLLIKKSSPNENN